MEAKFGHVGPMEPEFGSTGTTRARWDGVGQRTTTWRAHKPKRQLEAESCQNCGELQKRECDYCLKLLPIEAFNKVDRGDGKEYHGRVCRKCIYLRDPERAKRASKSWRETKRIEECDYFSNSNKRSRDRNYKHIVAYLSEYPCSRCGETDIEVLEFDHLDPSEKEYNVSQLATLGYSLEKLQTEMDKCQVLCSNCHRKKTIQDRGGTVRSKLLQGQ